MDSKLIALVAIFAVELFFLAPVAPATLEYGKETLLSGITQLSETHRVHIRTILGRVTY